VPVFKAQKSHKTLIEAPQIEEVKDKSFKESRRFISAPNLVIEED